MASIELVIKIPENFDLSKIQNGSIASKVILNAVANGIPLPKGHGRLVDIDTLEKEICRFDIYHSCGSCKYMDFCTYDAPTIIGADKESD